MQDPSIGSAQRNSDADKSGVNNVTLDEYEVEWAKSVGYHRHCESERRGLKQSDGSQDKNALKNHQQGAALGTSIKQVPEDALERDGEHI